MEQGENLATAGAATTLATKSWTAYVPVTLWTVAGLSLAIAVGTLWSVVAGVALALVDIGVAAYEILMIRSHRLYYDDVGVWHSRGILPWSRGVAGVKWRDIDEAVFFQSIWSWLFASYTVRIGHRFTKASEIVVTHMGRGNNAVATVNTLHHELVRSDRLR